MSQHLYLSKSNPFILFWSLLTHKSWEKGWVGFKLPPFYILPELFNHLNYVMGDKVKPFYFFYFFWSNKPFYFKIERYPFIKPCPKEAQQQCNRPIKTHGAIELYNLWWGAIYMRLFFYLHICTFYLHIFHSSACIFF